ncbi:transmembrane 9 superfamily member 3-like protein [Cinnamomum micranthum f. kanehirae]|uniref:Transmembrane 9 superfamily member n=1 Tax=Cinnamomum micranthum f. kanehirae TaxID=337451 RepID=A0A443NM08_9MAGN|nr:transmembrane 9 superfamily member 3-like protein [Cinnamomum micranthum f. kanehirae]
MEKYLQIHWASVINSCATTLLMIGFLVVFLIRVLKNNFVEHAHHDESAEHVEETEWKYIHGDDFRYPKNKSLFAAAAFRSNTLLFTLTIFIFIIALVGAFYPYSRGTLFTALVVVYALTSSIVGYTATSFYCQLGGTNWVRNLMRIGCLFCGPLFLTFCFLHTVATVYNATEALPYGSIMVVVTIWTLVTYPLLVLGGIARIKGTAEFQNPCLTTEYPQEILFLPLPWYRRTIPQMAVVGFFPVIAIHFELYYIFATVCGGDRIYTTYSILFVAFIILMVSAFILVALTYFLLASEDHEWLWRSLLCGGKGRSTSLCTYGYCLYYMACMYMACICYGFFVMLGTVFDAMLCPLWIWSLVYANDFFLMLGYLHLSGACICYGFFLMLGIYAFHVSLLFVHYIYLSIKC